jgi:TonB-linked SusC/RagA family outer membrane protein
MRSIRNATTLGFFLLCMLVTYGQQTITGTVTDSADGQPIPGANIVVQGTTTGAVTDFDGNYSISASSDATLVFSYIGYLTQEVPVNGQETIDVALSVNAEELSEVVVIGFGTQEREDVTGSIASVTGDALNETPVPSFEQALTGRAAGVQVNAGSGIPGAGASIRVRGIGSTNNAEPLYVIDGIIIGNPSGGGQSSISPLALINPNDIESIDVLKDASATAIYGARAGNGVVIITTKRGTEGRMTLNYDVYTAMNYVDKSKLNMMDGRQWAGYISEIQAAAGNTNYTGKPFIDKVLNGFDAPQNSWFEEAYNPGQIISHNLSLNAGTERSQYFSSLSYFDQEGILPNSDLKRYTLRFNSDHNVTDRLKFGNTLTISRSEANTVGNVNGNSNLRNWISRLITTNPYKPIYSPDGSYAGISAMYPDAEGQLDYANQHVISDLENQFDKEIRNRILASIYADLEIVEHLDFHVMGSVDWSFNNNERRLPANGIDGAANLDATSSSLNINSSELRTWFIESTLTYANTFGKHNVSLMGGYQAQNELNKGFGASAGGFVNTDYWFFDRPQLTNDIVDSEGNIIATVPLVFPGVSNFQNESAFVSLFGRFIYDYDSRYLLTATVRRDGSSRFGRLQRWGTFPAASAGWRISQEKFMENFDNISNLKLRVGYGISGSDNTSLYQPSSVVSAGEEEEYVLNGGPVPGATVVRLGNPALSWEEIKMFNVGLDLGLYGGRLKFTIDYFDKITDGLLLPFTPASETGAIQNPSGNLGKVSNKGLELAVNSINVTSEDFYWSTDFNISTVKNEVLALPEDADRFTGVNLTRVGEEIGSLYGFETNGVFQNWQEVYAHAYQNQSVSGFNDDGTPIYSGNTDQGTINSNTAPGDLRFFDQNGDGIVDADEDRVITGSTIPDFNWGLTNTFNYKNFDLSILLQGVHGIDVYNGLRVIQERATAVWENKSTTVLDRWTGEGTSNSIPRSAITDPNANERVSSHWVEDASFVRIKNARLSYSPSLGFLKDSNMKTKIYVVGTNLFTFTEYSGLDPEIGLREGNNPEAAGFDGGIYPLTRQFTLGVQVSF